MAFIGLSKPYIAELVSESGLVPTYRNCFKCGKAVSTNVTPNYNEAKLYADNQLGEYVKEFKDGTVALGTDRLPKEAQSTVFGHTVNGNKTTYKTGDSGPYVGVGFIVERMEDGAKKYEATILYKCKFTEGANEYVTKGESIEFKTASLEGTISGLNSTTWKDVEVFDTEVEAESYIQSILGYAETCAIPVADVAQGEYEEAQTVTLTCATAGVEIYYTTNGTTPAEANGTKYSSPISIAASCLLKAIAVKSSKNNSPVVAYEYIIS